MLGTLLMVALVAPTQAPPGREVVATAGPVTLLRDDRLFRLVPRSELAGGDQVNTGPEGGTLFLDANDRAIQLGPETALTLGNDDGAVVLGQGEIRAIAGKAGLRIGSSLGETTVARGIARVASSQQGLRVWAERGTAEVRAGDGRIIPLAANQEVLIAPDGPANAPEVGRDSGWAIDVEGFQLAAAAESSRRRKGMRANEANDQAAETFRDGGQDQPGSSLARSADEAPADGQQQTSANTQDESAQDPGASTSVTQLAATSAISLALGSASASQGAGSSGGLFSDAQQDSLTNARDPATGLPLAGNVHLVTARTRYPLGDVQLRASDAFPITREFWSIGLGESPTSRVATTFRTGSDPTPQTIRIPRFDAYLVRFPESNFGIPDPATTTAQSTFAGVSGLVGTTPTAPQVQGATPLVDNRAEINDRATFALGEFALDRNARNKPVFEVRRSDQDRRIIKSADGNDNKDQVTLNPRVKFQAAQDSKFFPEIPQISRPIDNNPLDNPPTYGKLDPLRRASATTLLADRLGDYSRRTGRTRFVLDGKVVDIAGYRSANPLRSPVGTQATAAVGVARQSGAQRR